MNQWVFPSLGKDVKLVTGDIIFVGSSGWIARAIRWGDPFQYTHVAVYLGNGKIIEADGGKVRISSLGRYFPAKGFSGEVVRLKMSHAQQKLFVSLLKGEVNFKYDYKLIFILWLLGLFGVSRNLLTYESSRKICSNLISKHLSQVLGDIHWPVPLSLIKPSDLFYLLKESIYFSKKLS